MGVRLYVMNVVGIMLLGEQCLTCCRVLCTECGMCDGVLHHNTMNMVMSGGCVL